MAMRANHGAAAEMQALGHGGAASSSSDVLRAEITSPSIASSVSHQNSQVLAVSAKLSWKIEQFERLTRLVKNGKSLVSEVFFSPSAPSVKWELHLYPNGKREEDITCVSFFLRQIGLEVGKSNATSRTGDDKRALQQSSESLLADFQIYVVDAAGGNRLSICRDAKEFTNQQGRGKFQVARERLIHYVHNDGNLHLCCDVEYLPNACTTARQEHKVWEPTPDRAIAIRDRVADLYNDSLHTDFEIQINGQVFRTHRAILAHASEVFDGMFKNGMRESLEGFTKIGDTTVAAVRAMLDYIYTNSIERGLFEKNARDILIIADRYNVGPLKEECERYIAESLNTKNFGTLMPFADLYSCDVLMARCREFLVNNCDAVTGTREWADLKLKQPAVITDILEKTLHDRIGSTTSRPSAGASTRQSPPDDGGEPLAKRTRRTRS